MRRDNSETDANCGSLFGVRTKAEPIVPEAPMVRVTVFRFLGVHIGVSELTGLLALT